MFVDSCTVDISDSKVTVDRHKKSNIHAHATRTTQPNEQRAPFSVVTHLITLITLMLEGTGGAGREGVSFVLILISAVSVSLLELVSGVSLNSQSRQQ